MLHDEHQLAARADLARLLSACFCQPTEEFIAEALFGQTATAAAAIDPALGDVGQDLHAAADGVALQDLLIDYTRLFLGPARALAAPYGSVWSRGDPSANEQGTAAVEALYREAGFETAEDVQDLPDHVSVELEFMYAQLFAMARARIAGDAPALQGAQRVLAQLLEDHLGRWAPAFLQAVGAAAQTGVYRALARLTGAFIEHERRLAQSS